jgi:hypothetical protein
VRYCSHGTVTGGILESDGASDLELVIVRVEAECRSNLNGRLNLDSELSWRLGLAACHGASA